MLRWIAIALLVCSLVVYSARSEVPSQTLFEQGHYREAIPILQQNIRQFERQNDRVNQGVALVNLAISYRNLSQWDLAEASAEQSLSLLSGKQLAHALDIRAKLHLERGNPQSAYDRWTQAASIYQDLLDKENWYQVQADRSLALQNLGLYPRACALLGETLDLPGKCTYSAEILAVLEDKINSRSGLALVANLGRVMQVLGELDGSQKILNLGLKIANNFGNIPEVNSLWLNLGNTLRNQKNNYRSALEAYKRSGLVEGEVNQISLLIQLADLEQAISLWQSTYDRLQNSSTTTKINFARSGIQLASKHPKITPQIDELLSATLEEAKALNHPRLVAHTLLLKASLAELNQDFLQAQKLNQSALQITSSPDITYLLYIQAGRLAQKTGQISRAITDYSAAIKSLSQLRQDLVNLNSDVQYNFREGVEPIYRELVSLLLKDDRPSQTELRQAREVIESLQIAELDNFFRDACADTNPTNIDEIDPNAAIFYPIVLKDRLEIIVAIPQQPLFHTRVPISRQTLNQTVQDARNSLRLTAFPKERIIPTTKLYEWLIRPTETLLTNNKIATLIIIPDDSLRNLPFNILWDGSKYLIEKYNLALVPSLQLVAPKPLTKETLKVTGAGLIEARQGFPSLPAVEEELQKISRILPTNTLLNAQFTEASFRQKVATIPAPIVHLATHGQFSSDANSTFLLTWDDRIKVKELGTILRDTPVELLVLSACETAAGDDRANLGIAGFAIRSGARSTIAALWPAFDESTAILMARFYEELIKPGVNKSQALRNAQISLLSHPVFSRPYYWAPFLLLGNWQ